jgi:hypothetical protein
MEVNLREFYPELEAGHIKRHCRQDLWSCREFFYLLAWRDILLSLGIVNASLIFGFGISTKPNSFADVI